MTERHTVKKQLVIEGHNLTKEFREAFFKEVALELRYNG